MAQKSKTLLQLLQQQQHHQSLHDETNISMEYQRTSSEHTEKKQDIKLQKSIFELYTQIKANLIKTEDQLLLCQIKKIVPLDKQFDEQIADSNSILCYIGCIFTQLMQDRLSLEQQLDEQKARDQSDYEEQLIKLEAEIRQHIRIEQQLKLFAENTQSKLEDTQKSKEELDEELQQLKSDYQTLYDKCSTLNLKLKSSEQEYQILKNEFNSYKTTHNQSKILTKKDNNIENQDFNQKQPISINLQLDRYTKPSQSMEFYERIMTEPQEIDHHNKSKNESQKKLQNTQKLNMNPAAQRISTETYEIETKKRRSNISHYDTNQSKHQRVKTVSNVSQLLIDKQELKRQPSNKTYQDHHKSQIANKPKKPISQHSDVNRSNNSIHSFRKQQNQISTDFSQIPRPFSSVEQIEDQHRPSFHKDLSMDMGNYQKDYNDNQQQIKKLLQQYQQKHPLNDHLTKKLLQEYKKRQGCTQKSIY